MKKCIQIINLYMEYQIAQSKAKRKELIEKIEMHNKDCESCAKLFKRFEDNKNKYSQILQYSTKDISVNLLNTIRDFKIQTSLGILLDSLSRLIKGPIKEFTKGEIYISPLATSERAPGKQAKVTGLVFECEGKKIEVMYIGENLQLEVFEQEEPVEGVEFVLLSNEGTIEQKTDIFGRVVFKRLKHAGDNIILMKETKREGH